METVVTVLPEARKLKVIVRDEGCLRELGGEASEEAWLDSMPILIGSLWPTQPLRAQRHLALCAVFLLSALQLQ